MSFSTADIIKFAFIPFDIFAFAYIGTLKTERYMSYSFTSLHNVTILSSGIRLETYSSNPYNCCSFCFAVNDFGTTVDINNILSYFTVLIVVFSTKSSIELNVSMLILSICCVINCLNCAVTLSVPKITNLILLPPLNHQKYLN